MIEIIVHKPYSFCKDQVVEPFYIDHKRLNLLTKTKLLQLKLLNFSLLLIDERAGDKLKLNYRHKSEYRTV